MHLSGPSASSSPPHPSLALTAPYPAVRLGSGTHPRHLSGPCFLNVPPWWCSPLAWSVYEGLRGACKTREDLIAGTLWHLPHSYV